MVRAIERYLRAGGLLVAAATVWGCSDLEPLGQDGAAAAGGSEGSGGAGGSSPSSPAPYTIQLFDRARISSNPADENFHRIRGGLELRDAPFSRVSLVAELESTCYPFESWADNPPPPGENWPADCDAFDRNFEIVLDPPLARDPPPAIELVRAITPFGGPMRVEQDITDLANAQPGHHSLQVQISTWSDGSGQVTGSDGGWTVSVRLEVVPGQAERQVLSVVPLYYGTHRSETGPGPLTWTVPEGATAVRIDYRATGHGGGAVGSGCIGPAEEFCRREHALWVDGAELWRAELWRDDCDELCTVTHYGPVAGGFDYCLENPCGHLSSVRAPRANWCPGSVTPPIRLESPTMAAAGSHSFDWTIDRVEEGGSWRISAAAYVYGD